MLITFLTLIFTIFWSFIIFGQFWAQFSPEFPNSSLHNIVVKSVRFALSNSKICSIFEADKYYLYN